VNYTKLIIKNILLLMLLFLLTIALVDIFFFRSGTAFHAETLGPAFRSNAAAKLQANASGSITTPIGARLQASLPRVNFSNFVAKPSKIYPIKKENTEQNETKQIAKKFHQNLDQYLETVQKLNSTVNQTKDKQQIQQAVSTCRNAFKTINFFVDYQCTRSNCISPRRFTSVR